ncbi:hypothetical protein KH5H1_57080 [Corallococcus caeni]|uniref:hypothetical protein n=1 Tax=Corallococcus caeni TaxID=3082388 RepID=UPI002957106F|nr:hypothetical protein KH5H1_57080 [Corallococcus sp. KH5-1]
MQPTYAPRRDGIPLRADVDRIDPESQRFYKVRKHLMEPIECWHLVCPGLPPDPRNEARRAGCSELCLQKDIYRFELASDGCRQHVLGAHDLHFEPAYWRAFDSAVKSGHLAFAFKKNHVAMAAGDEGVFVVLSRERGSVRWRVNTAFRPEPRRQDGPPGRNQSFLNAARRKWLAKTTQPAKARMRMSPTWSDPLAQELGAFLDRIEQERMEALDVHDAARVLVLMARAEQLGSSESLKSLLRRGLPHISGLATLAPPDEVKPLLVELDAACQAGDDSHGVLHDVLLDLDDWLSVAMFLEHHGVPLPAIANAAARDHVVRFAATRLALSPEQAAPLADWALARAGSLEPEPSPSSGDPYAPVMALWQAVVRASATAHQVKRPTESLGAHLVRILDAISLTGVIPRDAFASSGIDLGPEPVEIHRWGDAVLELTIGQDLRTPVLQVSGTEGDEAPRGTRDGTPLTFTRDEFQAWLAEARPGLHHVSLRGKTVEFTLTTS